MLPLLVFLGASKDGCFNFCNHFKNESLVAACKAGCLWRQSGAARPVRFHEENRRTKFEVQDECRNYCDSIEEQVGHAIAPCKASCAFYDESKGLSSCGCESTSSDYDRSCREGCNYMNHVWNWEGGWE